MTTTRHEFLARLHHLLTPRGYLEVGVHTGESLRLASCPSIGIDPAPMVDGNHLPHARVFTATSDDWFTQHVPGRYLPALDLAFIDGMHLFEYALRDFTNIEKHSNRRTVVAFDDVLPRNQGEANRVQCPGDWTGDVWRVYHLLQECRPDLTMLLVDTFPTGTLLVWGLDREMASASQPFFDGIEPEEDPADAPLVPDDILFRSFAVSPQLAINRLKEEVAA